MESTRNAVEAAVRRSLEEAGLARGSATLLCALSGGADSVALLTALLAEQTRTGARVACVHVEHGLRGADSVADAAFVQALCARRGVPLRLYRAGLDAEAPAAEARARAARREAYRDAMAAFAADALLTAHHADDQLETVLMRLLRGGGAAGLRGIPERAAFAGGLLLRPLLGVPREALRAYAAEAGEGHCEDATNRDPAYLRNRVRQTLRALPPDELRALRAHALDSAALLASDEDCLRAQTDALLARAAALRAPYCCAAVAPLLAAPEALRLRAVRALYETALAAVCRPDAPPPLRVCAWDERGHAEAAYAPGAATAPGPDGLPLGVPVCAGGDAQGAANERFPDPATPRWLPSRPPLPPPDERGLSRAQTLTLEALLRAPAGTTCNLPCGLLALRAQTRLHLVWQEGRAPLYRAEGAPRLPLSALRPGQPARWAGWTFTLSPAEGDAARAARALPPDDPARLLALLLPQRAANDLALRLPGPGDRLRPLGASGSKPLRRWLLDRKVDAPLLPFQPVLADAERVWWLPGLAFGEAARLPASGPLLRLEARPPQIP